MSPSPGTTLRYEPTWSATAFFADDQETVDPAGVALEGVPWAGKQYADGVRISCARLRRFVTARPQPAPRVSYFFPRAVGEYHFGVRARNLMELSRAHTSAGAASDEAASIDTDE
jgi:hypothetical protein